jgi:hypothetical protein
MLTSKKGEWLPWYRRKDYRGNLTEEEKRFLDGLRQSGQHPASAYDELPEEAQMYILELEQSVYDAKQSKATYTFLLMAAIGLFTIFGSYRDSLWLAPIVGYLSGAGMIFIGWLLYSREFKRNADEYIPMGKVPDSPNNLTDEGLRRHYEMQAISGRRTAKQKEDSLATGSRLRS